MAGCPHRPPTYRRRAPFLLTGLLLFMATSAAAADSLTTRIADPPGMLSALPGPYLVAVVDQVAPEQSPQQQIPEAAAQPDSIQIYLRSPFGASMRSLLIPGWGQWYNGQKIKGIIMGVVQVVLIAGAVWQNQRVVSAASENQRNLYESERSRLVWFLIGERGYSVLDAYVEAHFVGFDQDLGIELPEDE